jgi:uncharacterized protein YrrD
VRASELKGKPVFGSDRGRRIGSIQTVILDPGEGRLAGLRIRTGLFGPLAVVAADQIERVASNAVTLDLARAVSPDTIEQLDRFLDLSQLGRVRVVTASGQTLGPLRDVLIDPLSLTIVGYEVGRSRLDELRYGRLIVLVGERIAFSDDHLVVSDEAAGGNARLSDGE